MAQVDNEYGLFGTDQEYLQHIRATWRQGLGNGVVIHSTDPASGQYTGRLLPFFLLSFPFFLPPFPPSFLRSFLRSFPSIL